MFTDIAKESTGLTEEQVQALNDAGYTFAPTVTGNLWWWYGPPDADGRVNDGSSRPTLSDAMDAAYDHLTSRTKAD